MVEEVNKVNYVSKTNMVVRPIRYRYPITSEQVTDMMDEVYNELVDILGYYNKNGVLLVSGCLRELWQDVDDSRCNAFGYQASGITEALSFASGTLSHTMSDLGKYEAYANSFYRNRV